MNKRTLANKAFTTWQNAERKFQRAIFNGESANVTMVLDAKREKAAARYYRLATAADAE